MVATIDERDMQKEKVINIKEAFGFEKEMGEFKPFSESKDGILRVEFENCSFTEVKINDNLTLFKKNHSKDEIVGFEFKSLTN